MNSEAKSSETFPRFQDIPVGFTTALAEVFSIGHAKYDTGLPPGVKNYQKGDASYFLARLDHAYAHLEKVKAGCLGLSVTGDEHDLMHAVANLAMLFWAIGHGVLPAAARAEDRRRPTFTFLRREPEGVAVVQIRWPSGSRATWRASKSDVAALIAEYGICDGLDAALRSFDPPSRETDTTARNEVGQLRAWQKAAKEWIRGAANDSMGGFTAESVFAEIAEEACFPNQTHTLPRLQRLPQDGN